MKQKPSLQQTVLLCHTMFSLLLCIVSCRPLKLALHGCKTIFFCLSVFLFPTHHFLLHAICLPPALFRLSACMPLSPHDMEIDCDLLSVSKAYHLGQEETDWFEKPRSSSRHYSGHSSGRSRHSVKHTYHDYDEPPEEDLWPQDEYGQGGRHSSSRDHRHHGSSSRHSSSRHSDELRSTRSSKGHPKDPLMRHDPSGRSSSSGRRGESRSGGYHSTDYRDPSGHHHGQRSSRQGDPHRSSRSKSQGPVDMQGQPPGMHFLLHYCKKSSNFSLEVWRYLENCAAKNRKNKVNLLAWHLPKT